MAKIKTTIVCCLSLLVVVPILFLLLFILSPNHAHMVFPKVPVWFSLEKEIDLSNNQDCAAYFDRAKKNANGEDYTGDFIQNMNVYSDKSLQTCIGYGNLEINKASYFVTNKRKIEQVKEDLFHRIILSKWPSALITFEAVNDSKIRLYRINRKSMNWPK